jgi:hypothetical protein
MRSILRFKQKLKMSNPTIKSSKVGNNMRYLIVTLLFFIGCSNPVTQDQLPIGKGRFFALVETENINVETIDGDTVSVWLNCGGSAVVFKGTTVVMIPLLNDSNIVRYDTLPESLMVLQLKSTHFEGRIQGDCQGYETISSIPCVFYPFQDFSVLNKDSVYITGYDENGITMKYQSRVTRLSLSDSLVVTGTILDTIQYTVNKRSINRSTMTHTFKLGAVLNQSMVEYN